MTDDVPFGDDRPLPPPLTAAQLKLLGENGGTPDVATEDGPTQPHSWQPASLMQLAANPPEPPTIGGLLYPGKRTILSGETESMKTWLALILCKAELDLGLTVGWADLDAMGPGAMLERLQLLGVDDQALDERFLYYQPSDPLDPAKMTEIVETITTRQLRLFVIDAFNPILSLHGLEPNATPDIETFWRTIADPIAAAGAAPVLLDHVVKNAENRGKYAYGSERKASGAIVHIGFKLLEPLTKGGRGRTLLTVHKDRPGYLPRPAIGRLVLTSDGTTIAYQLEPDLSHTDHGFRPTVLMEKVSRFLEQQLDAVTKGFLETSVTGKAEAIRTAIQTLKDDAFITQTKGDRGALHYQSIRPYREAQDTPHTTSSPARPDLVLDLRSSATSSSSPPLKGTRSNADPQDDLVHTPSSSPNQPIHEYDHPPLATDPEPPDDESWI